MASTDELLARIQILEEKINNAVALPDVIKKYDDPDVIVGDTVYGTGNGSIFGGDNFIATVVNAPVAASTDLSNEMRW